MFARFQQSRFAYAAERDELSGLAQWQISSKRRIKALQGLRDGTNGQQLMAEHRLMSGQQRSNEQRDDERHDPPAHPLQYGHNALQRRSKARRFANVDSFWHERRQHPTRHRSRRDQSGDREQAKLRQTLKIRKQQGREPCYGACHAKSNGSPQGAARCALPRSTGIWLGSLNEQINRIVHRLANQRDAEADGHAVDHGEA